ncbi:hypothetical protein GCM10023148_19980 [Actinokineospora soli]
MVPASHAASHTDGAPFTPAMTCEPLDVAMSYATVITRTSQFSRADLLTTAYLSTSRERGFRPARQPCHPTRHRPRNGPSRLHRPRGTPKELVVPTSASPSWTARST